MKFQAIILFLVLGLGLGPGVRSLSAESEMIQIESLGDQSEMDFDYDSNRITFQDTFSVTYSNLTLRADSGWVDMNQPLFHAQGNAMLQTESGEVWRGNYFTYQPQTQLIQTDRFRTGSHPLFVEGKRLVTQEKTYFAQDAYLTLDDVSTPGLRLQAKEIEIQPNASNPSYLARNAVLYAGKTPIFYWPYLKASPGQGPSQNLEITPGYRGRYGAYLLSSYQWYSTETAQSAVNLDLYSKRGIGLGPTFSYDSPTLGKGEAEYYYLRDSHPESDFQGNEMRQDRQRFRWTHQMTLRTNLTATLAIRKLSDPLIEREFFERDFRKNPQPSTHFELQQLWSNHALNLLVRPQINTFHETVERLPDLKWNAFPQQIGVSPLYYDGESSAGYFKRRFASDNLASNDFAAMRLDSYHQITVPRTLFGRFTLSPRVGGRFTHYGESHGKGILWEEQNRWVFNTGAELSTKATRTWATYKNSFLDINGLRHIIRPSINYVYVPTPSERPIDLPSFDRELNTYRLLPIEFPDYHAIDSIDSQNVLRLSLFNHLQTKRGTRQEDLDHLLHWGLFTDWRLRPRHRQSGFSDLYSDLDFKPRSWLTFSSEIRWDLDQDRFAQANHYVTISPNTFWSWSLGHRFLHEDNDFGFNLGQNLVTSSLYLRFNENWGFHTAQHLETRDGVLEEQYYALYRDFRFWTAALTFRHRNPRFESNDYTIGITFSLKAFPRYGVEDDYNRPYSTFSDYTPTDLYD